MNKTDYLRKKGELPIEDLGVIYTFKSDRKGVSEIKESLVYEKNTSPRGRQLLNHELSVVTFKLKESPFEVNMRGNEVVSTYEGHGSGCGDLWEWTYFASLVRKALEEA